MKTYGIVREYDICGEIRECYCDDAGLAITNSEDVAKARVEKLHQMGYPSARYYEIAEKDQWWNDNNWIG